MMRENDYVQTGLEQIKQSSLPVGTLIIAVQQLLYRRNVLPGVITGSLVPLSSNYGAKLVQLLQGGKTQPRTAV